MLIDYIIADLTSRGWSMGKDGRLRKDASPWPSAFRDDFLRALEFAFFTIWKARVRDGVAHE